MGNIVKKQKDGPLTVAEDDGVFVTTNPKQPKKKLKNGQLLLDNAPMKQVKDLETF